MVRNGDGDNDVVITPQIPMSADVKVTIDTSKTPNLSVVGQSEFTFTGNGTLTYTLKNSTLSAAEQNRTFTVPILNIDKEAPEALVSFSSETEMDDDGKLLYYSVTYSIVGFSNEDDDVTLISGEEGATALSSVTFSFDTPAAERTYTFRFRDRAVNLTLTGKTNILSVSVPLPANTIDLTAPTGSVKYEVDPLNADNVRAYIVTTAEDLVEESVHLTGSMIDGTPFKLEKDAKGYYVVLHVNGVGKFHLPDKAGNIGTVPIVTFLYRAFGK